MSPEEIAAAIAAKTKVALRPASAADLEALRALQAPTPVLSFYERFEPADGVEFNRVRLCPIRSILEENHDYVPGADLYPHGYLVFATTLYGDTYCLDLNDPGPPVIIMTHEVTFEGMAPGEIKRYRRRVADDFLQFLERFVAGHGGDRAVLRSHSLTRPSNQRLKLSARGGRLVGNGSVLSAAAAGRSLSAIR
jgi:hypothetical protein